MPRPHHPKRSIEVQVDLKKTSRKAGVRSSNVPSYLTLIASCCVFEDEARVGRISREMSCWVKASMGPSVARQMIREYIYAYLYNSYLKLLKQIEDSKFNRKSNS